MSTKIYQLVIFDITSSKGVINAKKKIIDKEDAKVLLQDANATISAPEIGKYKVVEKRLFEFSYMDGDTKRDILFIVVDAEKQSK